MAEWDYWSFFVGEAKRAQAPLYVRLAEGIGGDEKLRTLAHTARPGQPPANLLLGAVHYLLLRGVAHPLREFYGDLGGTRTVDDGDPFPLFRDFVEIHRDDIARIVSSRVTNTNEVGRSAVLHAGFRQLAAKTGTPLHLIEIGPSAGLNMIWDRYGVRYHRGDESFLAEPSKAELVIDSELRGEKILPHGAIPEVTRRVGLEINPVNLGDADARDWLRALVWPDHRARMARFEKALAIFAREKPDIRVGDALALLPEAMAEADVNQTLCIYHTIATYQFTQDMRDGLEHMLIAAGLRRPVWHLSCEFAGDHRYPLTLAHHHDGTKSEDTLALCDPHGAWIEWLS